MVGGAAGDDHDPAHVAQELVGDADVAELDALGVQAVGQRLGDRVGLLVDLLEHEGLVAALLGGLVVPLDLLDLALDRAAVDRLDEARARGGDLDDLAVLDELDVARLGEEGRDRGGDEALAVAEADDQRALLAGADEHARVVRRHRDEGVVAAQLVVGLADGLGEVAVEVLGDQVRHDLGVGLGGELGAVGLAGARAGRSSSRRSR